MILTHLIIKRYFNKDYICTNSTLLELNSYNCSIVVSRKRKFV